MPLSQVQPARYAALLAEKVAAVRALLDPFDPPSPEVVPSAPTGYRLRAEFRVWHQGDDLDYVMFPPGDSRSPFVVSEFPVADVQIQQLMPLLLAQLRASPALRKKLFQVEFLATLAGDMLVTLVYHRKLEADWEAAAADMRSQLQGSAPRLSIIGRSRRQKLVLGRDYVEEELAVQGRAYRYRQYEQSFTQPNGRVNVAMIDWACRQAQGRTGDLLELYCGNGNFTLPLARAFDTVIATELSKNAVRAALANREANGVDNLHIVRLAAEEVTQAINGAREFRRLRELPRPLADYRLQTLFVDPPRAGLDAHTVAMAGGFDTVIYVSCNPQTLAQNIAALDATHRLAAFALFDQFPYTHHMECGVVLSRRQ